MKPIPTPDITNGWHALRAWREQGNILGALEAVHDALGDVFRLPLPGFNAIFLVGPEANKFLLTEERVRFRWRAEQDPVTRLLRNGVLVEDGTAHDTARSVMDPALHRGVISRSIEMFWQDADQVIDNWSSGMTIKPLVEMRRLALLVLFDTLFCEDFRPHIEPLWRSIQAAIAYISPGAWLLWPEIPRPQHHSALRRLHRYFDELIERRRMHDITSEDLVGRLIASGMDDVLIHDQLLTLFIAGHDTSTAFLAWALALLARHPDVLARTVAEIDTALRDEAPTLAELKQLPYLDSVIKEVLRLYPPIHLGSRIAAEDLTFRDYHIAAGSRVLYSHYLTHRHRAYWEDPHSFRPERFSSTAREPQAPYVYIPFGGGPRNCIGAAFAQIEAKVVLARILQKVDLRAVGGTLRPSMRATLQPAPNTLLKVRKR